MTETALILGIKITDVQFVGPVGPHSFIYAAFTGGCRGINQGRTTCLVCKAKMHGKHYW